MRNLFDQYTQPENRLTHALVCCLWEDKVLLRRFIHWVTRKPTPTGKTLVVEEQSLPGEQERTEDGAEKLGLPDAWIHDQNGWALLIESKVASSISASQLQRHIRTASRRGFENITLLLISVRKPARKLPQNVKFKSWSEVYSWLSKQSAVAPWAKRVKQYLEVAESKLTADGYLREGTLTVFSGIPFDLDNPYNYLEAKRLLRLALDELRSRDDLRKRLAMDTKAPGRGAITGKESNAVWDFLRLKSADTKKTFTNYPHLTLALESDRVIAIVTIPNGIKSSFRRRLLALGVEGFSRVLLDVEQRLLAAIKGDDGAAPWIQVVQRRYPTQKSQAIMDARLEFDLRTAFPRQKKRRKGVKTQPQWLNATYEALANKHSNLQIAVGAIFPYRSSSSTKTRDILNRIAKTWLACKPLLDVMKLRSPN